MSDLTEWLKERRETRRGADGQLTATSSNHGNGVFHLDGWPVAAGGGVSRAIVDAHNTLPALLTAVEKVLEVLDAGVRDGDSAELIRRVALMEIEGATNG